MKNITLTTNNGKRSVLVNWNNVDFAKNTSNQFGDDYVEVLLGAQVLDVAESLSEIEDKLKPEAKNWC